MFEYRTLFMKGLLYAMKNFVVEKFVLKDSAAKLITFDSFTQRCISVLFCLIYIIFLALAGSVSSSLILFGLIWFFPFLFDSAQLDSVFFLDSVLFGFIRMFKKNLKYFWFYQFLLRDSIQLGSIWFYLFLFQRVPVG